MEKCDFFCIFGEYISAKQSVKNPKSQVILIDCQQFSELIRRFIFWDRFGFPGSFILKVSPMAPLKKTKHILHAMCANNLTFGRETSFIFGVFL